MDRETLIDFTVAQAVVWLPMVLGHHLRRRGHLGVDIARPVHRLTVTCLAPLVFTLGVWKLDRTGSDWWKVPLVYGLMLIGTGVIALTVSPRLFSSRKSIASHILLVAISNIAHTMAGFLTILLIGAAAYPLNAILMLPSCLLIFLVWLPAANHWRQGGEGGFARNYWRLVFSPLSMPLVGIAVGLALNFGGVPMGTTATLLMKILVFATTVLSMFAIGSRLHLRHALGYWLALRWVYLAKFIVHPVLAMSICLVLGIEGPAAGVVLIAAFMPAGVMPIQFATIQDFDVDLANAGFLLSTAVFMGLVLPIMIGLLRLPYFN